MSQSLREEAPATRVACGTAVEGKSMTDGLTVHLREKFIRAGVPRPTERRYRGGYRGTHTPHCLETVECPRRFTQLDDADDAV